MTRSIAYLSLTLSLALGTAAAQAVVESGLGAARAATSTAPANGLGKSMGGLAGSLEKALKAAQQNSDVQPSAAAAATPAPRTSPPSAALPPGPSPNWEDPVAIEAGLPYEELVSRFGPPTMTITASAEKLLTYRGKDGMFQVKVQDGEVKSIDKPRPRS